MLGWLTNAYNSVTGTIDRNVQNWVHIIVNSLYSYFHTIFGNVSGSWGELAKGISTLTTGVTDLGIWTHYALYYILKVWIPEFTKFVTQKIIDQLVSVVKWVGTEGALITYYLNNPDSLVNLIWDSVIAKLESSAAETAERLGKFFMVLITKNLGLVLKIIEDIIDATL
jgi:hypothetical protein